ncbi:MAG: thioesterase family protein [Gaiellaceae bacterium]
MHEKRLEIRWRDLDAYGHANNAVYLTYLEECRDEWLDRAVGELGPSEFVIARVEIDFRRELRIEDDEVVVRCRLERIGTSSVTTEEEIRTTELELVAAARAVVVAQDRATRRTRALRPEERVALEKAG